MAADSSCREVLRTFLGWLGLTEQRAVSPRTAAYCRARRRLGVKSIQQVHAQITEGLEAAVGEGDLWYGRRVKVVDGSSVSMPDTPENQAAYPQPSSQTPGCGFPLMRIVAVFSLATGALLALAKEAMRIGEGALFRQLWDSLRHGEVALTDCGFCSYAHVYLLRQRGTDIVMRNHQRRQVGLHVIKRLVGGDRLVGWHKTSPCPEWMSRSEWEAVPEVLVVREIRYHVGVPGFRTRSLVIVTTLLDPKAFPKRAFVELYRRRWMAELFLRDIKDTMHFDILRCKTPDMIERELWMHLIAYNLVRALLLTAAHAHRLPIEHLSFKGTLSTVRQWAPFLAADLDETMRGWLTDLLLKYIAGDPLPHRPNRCEPRARKRRPKNYQLLTKPRHLFLEIRHRNRYKKPLS